MIMATAKTRSKRKARPLVVQLINASGKPIIGVIPSGELPDTEPGLAIAREMGKHKHIQPIPVP
jgi:hypothetical protein